MESRFRRSVLQEFKPDYTYKFMIEKYRTEYFVKTTNCLSFSHSFMRERKSSKSMLNLPRSFSGEIALTLLAS